MQICNKWLIYIVILITFICIPLGSYADAVYFDNLRNQAAKNKDGGNSLKNELSDKEKEKRSIDGGVVSRPVIIQDKTICGPAVEVNFEKIGDFWKTGKLSFGGVVTSGAVRKLGDIRDVLKYPEVLDKLKDKDNPEIYMMFRDLAATAADKKIIEENGLRFDITAIPPGMVGEEFIKTAGHFHPAPGIKGKPGIKESYTEVYIVLSGKADYYLQQEDEAGNVLDAVWIEAEEGDIVPIPSTYGHITINSSDKILVMANWVDRNFDSVYEPIKNMKGGAYYFVKDENGEIKLVLNEAYKEKRVADIRESKVSLELAKRIGFSPKESVYNVIHNPVNLKKLVEFLSHPSSDYNLQFLANGLVGTDSSVYEKTGGDKFDDFVNTPRDIIASVGLVLDANSIFTNPASLTVLKKVKDAGGRIGVWANDMPEMERLDAIGIEVDAMEIGIEKTVQQMNRDKPDFYIIGKDTFDKKYKVVSVSEVRTKNKKVFGKLMEVEGMAALIESGDEHLVGVLKTLPVQMVRMSDIGYPVAAKVTIQSPWGEQTKPAGEDAYLVFEESNNQYYMVNTDPTGNPLSYVPAISGSLVSASSPVLDSKGSFVSGLQTQDMIRQRISEETPRYSFIKDMPVLAWQITSTNFYDIPYLIRRHLGKVDKSKYTKEYLAENLGSVLALQIAENKFKLPPERIKVIMSYGVGDVLVPDETLEDTAKRLKLDIITLPELNTQGTNLSYSMPLVIARAIKDKAGDANMARKYDELGRSLVNSGQISQKALEDFNNNINRLMVAPAIQVNDATARVQREYEHLQAQIKETVGDI